MSIQGMGVVKCVARHPYQVAGETSADGDRPEAGKKTTNLHHLSDGKSIVSYPSVHDGYWAPLGTRYTEGRQYVVGRKRGRQSELAEIRGGKKNRRGRIGYRKGEEGAEGGYRENKGGDRGKGIVRVKMTIITRTEAG